MYAMNRQVLLIVVVFALTLMSFGNYDKKGAEETKSVVHFAEQNVEEVTDEPQELVVKSIEVLIYGEHSQTITLRYDDKNRLVEVVNEDAEAGSIIYTGNEVKLVEDFSTTTYKYSGGKPTEGCIDMGEYGKINIKYTFDGDKISRIRRDFVSEGGGDLVTYVWNKDCIIKETRVYDDMEIPLETTFEYTKIRNPFTIDVLSIINSSPGVSSFGKGFVSEFLPSKSVYNGLTDGYIETVTTTTYEYVVDQATGKISAINIDVKEEMNDGGIIDVSTNSITVKLKY